MPTIQTTGTAIARNLHACQIISDRDIERVAKQIDTSHAPALAALEKVEELLTRYRDAGPPMNVGFREKELIPLLREVRLACFALSTGADHALLNPALAKFGGVNDWAPV